ncbi:hypothetical protein ACTJ2Q_001394 [Vibrio cholerae]|uniref:hypothetical protein n=1 Tax=Vibrio cholerae TaxID=666 RepID=UPI0003621CB8|nr:hypothetical protein [Vibrio cholerae]EGQ7979854.1 hypothetical protein [Vibrio cholerae]EGQ8141474.1 hypothetical protein [Vibrio cholerae]EGQ8531557.1 hypothetical protein [Vibrio cholerae]EGQ8559340.1 hypothetical protein [Vibrio cholerae]EGQ9898964.1 hypothetical protein [Vibrio cholerae]
MEDTEIDTMNNASFANVVCDANCWFERSRALIASARISMERVDILINQTERQELESVCYLLYGLALENLFKAVWVYRQYGSPLSEDWMPESKFPKVIQTHDLIKLAGFIDSGLSEKYKITLERLTEAIMWSGRYPCDLKPNINARFFIPTIQEEAESIYSEYRKIFTLSS